MLSRFSIKNSKKGIVPALCVGLALGMTACSDDDDDTIIVNNILTPRTGNVLVSQNGPNNAGTATLQGATNDIVGNSAPSKVFNTGGNEAIALDVLGNIIHNNDQNGADTVQLMSEMTLLPNNASFNPSRDGQINVAVVGAMKGGAYVPSRNMWVVAVFNGRTSAGSIAGISLASRGTSTSPVTPAFTTATFSGANVSGANGITATSPWDMVYDPAADRLFVAMTDGSVAVYDSFFTSTNGPNGASATRFFQFGATNAHGIVYDPATDTLVVTDVGAVTAGPNSDGRVFVIANASAATGTVLPLVNIAGNLTGLGNPVDLTRDESNNLVIAEKTNDTLQLLGSIPGLSTGNVAPRSSVSNTKPESVAVVNTSLNELVQPNDLRNLSSVSQLAVIQNPGDNTGASENTIVTFNPTTLASTGNTFTMGGIGTNSIENVAFANDGTAFMTHGNDSGAVTNTVGIGGIARVSMLFRATRFSNPSSFSASLDDTGLTGSNTGLVNPKGIEITDSQNRGRRIIVAEFDNTVTTPAIVVFGLLASGNVSPLARVTNLGSAGRRPWDLDYEPTLDCLFVACTDGILLRYDNFLANAGNNAGPTAIITPTHTGGTAAVNLHGIVYDEVRDQVFLSDVGAAGSSTDGRLFRMVNAKSLASGTIAVTASVTDPANLGNPVDITAVNGTLFVAEKASNGGRILIYTNFDTITGDLTNRLPNTIGVAVNPESITIMPLMTTNRQ